MAYVARPRMIRFRRLTLRLLDAWLVDQRAASAHVRYRLRVWREDRANLASIHTELVAYFDEALDDARRRIRRGFEDSLSPFQEVVRDPAANYPARLNRLTLQGYFGETLAGLAVEHWGALGHTDWVIPAFLFRYHDQEFQHLDLINQRILAGETHDPDIDAERRPGRTGDDAIAFRLDGKNEITDVLTLEAKCLIRHRSAEVEDAHRKLSAGRELPPGIRELISLLHEYDTPEAEMWQGALLRLWSGGHRLSARHDGIVYACGQIPVRTGRAAWLPGTAPLPAYTAARRLEGMEFQFEDLNSVLDTVYRGR